VENICQAEVELRYKIQESRIKSELQGEDDIQVMGRFCYCSHILRKGDNGQESLGKKIKIFALAMISLW